MNTFDSLGLDDHLLQSVRDLGFETPTPIQVRAIPVISAGKDVAECRGPQAYRGLHDGMAP